MYRKAYLMYFYRTLQKVTSSVFKQLTF